MPKVRCSDYTSRALVDIRRAMKDKKPILLALSNKARYGRKCTARAEALRGIAMYFGALGCRAAEAATKEQNND